MISTKSYITALLISYPLKLVDWHKTQLHHDLLLICWRCWTKRVPKLPISSHLVFINNSFEAALESEARVSTTQFSSLNSPGSSWNLHSTPKLFGVPQIILRLNTWPCISIGQALVIAQLSLSLSFSFNIHINIKARQWPPHVWHWNCYLCLVIFKTYKYLLWLYGHERHYLQIKC